jgi:hypothetical protein
LELELFWLLVLPSISDIKFGKNITEELQSESPRSRAARYSFLNTIKK